MGNTVSADVKLFPYGNGTGLWTGAVPATAGTAGGFDLRQITVPRAYRQHLFVVRWAEAVEGDTTGTPCRNVPSGGRFGLGIQDQMVREVDSAGYVTSNITHQYLWELSEDGSGNYLVQAVWTGTTDNKHCTAQGLYLDYGNPVAKPLIDDWLQRVFT